MKYLIILLIILISGIIGCTHVVLPYKYIDIGTEIKVPKKIYKIWLDKEFGESDKLSINEAIKHWNYALSGHIVLEVVGYRDEIDIEIMNRVMLGEGWIIFKIDSRNNKVIKLDLENGKSLRYTLAYVNRIGGNVMYVIRDRISNEWLEGIIMHEIGHLLGSDHDEIYLMRSTHSWEDYRCIDKHAISRVGRYQKIRISELNYCEYGHR